MSTGLVSQNHSVMELEDQCELVFPPDASPHLQTLFSFEKNFDFMGQLLFAKKYWTLSFYIVAVYLLVILTGQWLMRSRPASQLRMPLFFWNLILSVLSICGALRVVPEMVRILQEYGFTYSVCNLGSHEHMETVGLWGFLFGWSKVFELGDTVFIVLRKQNLIFLHWYHHITVLTGVWFGSGNYNSMGRWFMTTNYTVHAFMYTYYALKALRVRVPKAVSMVITAGQILQMVTCIYVTLHVYLVKRGGEHCCVPYRTLTIGVYLYASYFVLFLNYFLRAYVFTGRRAGVALPKKAD